MKPKTCKITKAPHEYRLMLPPHVSFMARDRYTPEEFYRQDDIEREELKRNPKRAFTGPRTRHWQCANCKKKGYDTEEKPDPELRNYTNNQNQENEQ